MISRKIFIKISVLGKLQKSVKYIVNWDFFTDGRAAKIEWPGSENFLLVF